MSVWLTEREFRQSGAEATGVTINVAFLHEIKQDNLPLREQTVRISNLLSDGKTTPRNAAELLYDYRDALETYFALEEFYGYFENAAVSNPPLSTKAIELKHEHEKLFLKLNNLIDQLEQIVYHECGPQTTMLAISELFDNFSDCLEFHEQHEMELMMRLCNEEFGVGD